MRLRVFSAVAVLGSAAILVLFGYHSFTEQINNSIILLRYAQELKSAAEGGRLPVCFERADWWGRQVAYVHSGDHFLVASFGRDGNPDIADYSSLLNAQQSGRPNSNCLIPWHDTVFVDGELYKGCLK
jgi:hypothetical protein